jgi:hypothetical protein
MLAHTYRAALTGHLPQSSDSFSLMWEAFRDRDFARKQWHRMHAKLSVEFNRRRGFPNLVRAREVKAAKRARAKEQVELEQRQAILQGNLENLLRRAPGSNCGPWRRG